MQVKGVQVSLPPFFSFVLYNCQMVHQIVSAHHVGIYLIFNLFTTEMTIKNWSNDWFFCCCFHAPALDSMLCMKGYIDNQYLFQLLLANWKLTNN